MVNSDKCQPVHPSKRNDRVVVLMGEHKGSIGVVAGIDASDLVIRFDNQSEIGLLEKHFLGKMSG